MQGAKTRPGLGHPPISTWIINTHCLILGDMAVTKDDVNLYINLITFVCFTRVLVFKFSAHLTTDDDDDDGFESNRIGSNPGGSSGLFRFFGRAR